MTRAARAAATPVPSNQLSEPLANAFARVPDAWRDVTDRFANSDVGQRLVHFIDERVLAGASVYPREVLHALHLTLPDQVRAVIVGQDPYHGPGQAHGLAFSVPDGQQLPPSLRNMLHEIVRDTSTLSSCGAGDLSPWARQGVLLLNSVLTVEAGLPASHAGRGWEILTDALLTRIAQQASPVVFLLWGAAAQRKRAAIDRPPHRVLLANHPSPLSARRPPEPFIGCRHFSQVNELLAQLRPGMPPIRW